MKKNIIIAALLLLALGTATAQDTVVTRTPKSTYFCYPAYDMDSTWFLQTHGYRFTPYGGGGQDFCLGPGEGVTVSGHGRGTQPDDPGLHLYTM